MDLATVRAWLAEEGVKTQAIDEHGDGYAWVEHVDIGGVSMLLADVAQRPFWLVETRFEVKTGELDQDTRGRLKLHMRSEFLKRRPDYRIDDTDDGLAVTLTRHLYPDCLDRQKFMDELRAMQHGGLFVSAEMDRFLAAHVQQE